MLSVSQITNSAGAASYFGEKDDKNHDDYYAREDVSAEWHGKGAAELGLLGEVNPEHFKEVLEGKLGNGVTLGRVGHNGETEHKAGWDLTFSAPKSVSILAEIGGDSRLIDAHKEAVKATLDIIESRAAFTRVKSGGEIEQQLTQNLVIATFKHETSRELDPQLHTHAVVANATLSEDGKWRSLESKEIYRLQKEAGLIYRQELAARTRALGYAVDKTTVGEGKKSALSFEIAGIKKELADHFSKRSQQVEAALEQRGKDRNSATAAEKEVAALATRKVKTSGDREELRTQWKAEAEKFQDLNTLVKTTENFAVEAGYHSRVLKEEKINKANEAIEFAVQKLSEREMSFRKSDLLAEVRNRNFGSLASEKDIQSALSRWEDRRELLPRTVADRWNSRKEVEGYTTPENVRTEAQMITSASLGKDRFSSIMGDADAKRFVAKASEKGPYKWSDDQLKTTAALLSSRDQFNAVQGAAGAAKTTTVLKTYIAEAKRRGYDVQGMAPSGAAAKQLQEGGGLSSKTVAKFLIDLKREEGENKKLLKELHYREKKANTPRFEPNVAHSAWKGYFVKKLDGNWRKANVIDSLLHHTINLIYKEYQKHKAYQAQEKLEKSAYSKRVWIVDEAGMVGTKQMKELLNAANKWNARVIFVGDTKQLSSVESGRAFHQMQSVMRTHRLETIVRQRDQDLLSAVYASYRDRADISVHTIQKAMKNLKEIGSDAIDRYRTVAKEYTKLSPEQREKTLVLEPSRNGRNIVNQMIRDELKKEGTVHGPEFGSSRLVAKGFTEAEKAQADSYRPGDAIKFQRDYKNLGANKDADYLVDKVDKRNNVVHLTSSHGETVAWNPAKYGKAEAFDRVGGGLAAGDRVIWTKNDKNRDMMNSDKATVLKIEGSVATFKNDAGKKFDVDLNKWGHWDLAYAQTVHSSQGRTAERVIAHLESTRANLVHQRSLYVAISRAKDEAIIVTDNAEELKAAVFNRSGENSIANKDGHDQNDKETIQPTRTLTPPKISQEDLDILLGNNRKSKAVEADKNRSAGLDR